MPLPMNLILLNKPKKLIKAIGFALYRFYKENYFYRASALAFATLLAIVPLVVVIVFFITFFPIFDNLILLAENYLFDNFIPSSASTIKTYFITFAQQAATMPMGSIIFLVITAIMLINTIEDTFNYVWKAPQPRKKWHALMFYWLVILLTPIIIGSSMFASTFIFKAAWMVKLTNLLQLTLIIDFILPIAINTLLFSLLYIAVPNVSVTWRYGLIGGLCTAIIFNFTRIGFVLYLEQFKTYTTIYGVFSIIPIFMIWLYIAWLIIIWGALFTYELQN